LTDIGFYHLTRTGPDQALPQLLGRTLAAGQRALVLCGSQDRVSAIDAVLWQSADPDWLPHGTAADGDADLQPIWLTTEDVSPNGARFLFLIDGAQTVHLSEFERVFDLFDGTDDAVVAAARERWTAAKTAGHTLTYWQQGPRGWEKKA
jgi:DNA polymerase III subunit chi